MDDDAFAAVRERFHFEFPQLYHDMAAGGCFDPSAIGMYSCRTCCGCHPVRSPSTASIATRFPGWCPLRAPPGMIVASIPASEPTRRCRWSFVLMRMSGDVYAPDFEGFIFRALLDSACAGLTEHYDLKQSHEVCPLHRSPRWLDPPGLAERLQKIDRRPAGGMPMVISAVWMRTNWLTSWPQMCRIIAWMRNSSISLIDRTPRWVPPAGDSLSIPAAFD